MMKSEFEAMALRGNEAIGQMVYDSIERFYTSDNEYHQAHGGTYESKQEFIKRVFGGKVNTPKTIAEKIARESIKENRWALRGNETATKTRLDEMDTVITEHYMYMYSRKM